jgi:N-acetylneuraminic acid mutarotase
MSARPRSPTVRVLLAGAVVVALVAVLFATIRDGEDEPPAPGVATASWGALTPSPLERTEVGAALIGDRIHVVGGYVGAGGSTAAMAIYDISEDEWEEGAALPVAVNHAGVAALEGDLYVLGGNLDAGDGAESKSARLFRYEPSAEEWIELRPAPTARAALGLVAIDGRLYAAGGSGARNERLRTLEIYDPARDRWTAGAPMPTGRNHVGAAVLGGDLVVTGGRPGPEHGGLAVVERYDPQRDRWQRMPPLSTARSGHATVAVAGGLVAFGGEELDGGTTIADVEFFDPAEDSWRPLPDMPTPRHGLGGAARARRVFALEGGPQPGLAFSDALEYLDVP